MSSATDDDEYQSIEEEDENTDSYDEDQEIENQGNSEQNQGDNEEIDNMPANGAGDGIPGSQLSAAREFAGKNSDDVEIWTAHIDRCKTTFKWSDEQTAQIALNKITDTAARWAEAQKSMGTEYNLWPALKEAIIKRFKAEISDATAAMAMSELQQQTSETVNDFYDRCILAMKKKEPQSGCGPQGE